MGILIDDKNTRVRLDIVRHGPVIPFRSGACMPTVNLSQVKDQGGSHTRYYDGRIVMLGPVI